MVHKTFIYEYFFLNGYPYHKTNVYTNYLTINHGIGAGTILQRVLIRPLWQSNLLLCFNLQLTNIQLSGKISK